MRVAIIPARGGSKRIPRKNIKDFCGKPIISYSIEAARASGIFDRIVVSTDDVEIAKIAKEIGAEVPSMRSGQSSSDYAVIADVLREEAINLNLNSDDEICLIYPTAPMIQKDFLIKSHLKFSAENADTLISVVKYSYPPQRGLVVENGMLKLREPSFENTRSQDCEPIYHDAGMFFWLKVERIFKDCKIFNEKCSCFEIEERFVQDIDTTEDWVVAELKHKILKAEMIIPPRNYSVLKSETYSNDTLTLRSIQPEDIETIRKWRNDQKNVLRQNRDITVSDQEKYFAEKVWPTFSMIQPPNILVSIIDQNSELIGYGGIVNISWENRRGEISFLLRTGMENTKVYKETFKSFLQQIKVIAFGDLNLSKLFTETYSFRTDHILTLEEAGFKPEGTLKKHVIVSNEFFNSIFHACFNERYDNELK